MTPENDALLCVMYPKIFVCRNDPVTQSTMGWGFSCGDGWFPLIDVLCARLQHETDQLGGPQVVASQVKEKYGGLRFYVQGASAAQHAMIDMAEALSERLCEICGAPGQVEG